MSDDGLTASQRYYRENRARIQERHREYYKKHREKILEQVKLYNHNKSITDARSLSVYKPACKTCGKHIPASSPYRGYCSVECYRSRWVRRGREGKNGERNGT